MQRASARMVASSHRHRIAITPFDDPLTNPLIGIMDALRYCIASLTLSKEDKLIYSLKLATCFGGTLRRVDAVAAVRCSVTRSVRRLLTIACATAVLAYSTLFLSTRLLPFAW